MVLIWIKLNPIEQRMICAKFGWNWPSGSGEEDILILSMYFRFFVITSPWKMVGPFIWRKLNLLHPRMVEIGSVLIWRRFLNFVNVFSLFRNYIPLEKGGGVASFEKNLNPLHPKMHCANFGWNWLNGSGEEDLFLISSRS